MNRTGLYLVIGVLAVAVVALGVYVINEQAEKPALEIRVDEQGLTVDSNG